MHAEALEKARQHSYEEMLEGAVKNWSQPGGKNL
jgi:hypothetical protein